MVIHRHLVVGLRAVWRCMVYEGSVVGCKQVVGEERVGCRRCGGCEWVLNVSVANFWREKHDGMEVRWGARWRLVVGLGSKEERLKKNAN